MNSKLTKKQKRISEILILIVIITFSILLWETVIIYPIKLFVVLFHEISHGIAAIITGGEILSLNINLDLSGNCTIEGGNTFVIASSGYLGSLLIGLFIIYSSYNNKYRSWILISLAIISILFTINKSTNGTLPIILIFLSGIILLLIRYSPEYFSNFILRVIGIISCLYVIIDIRQDILTSHNNFSDATIISTSTGISEYVWGVIWILISITGLLLMLRIIFKK
jgi:hypothetical protein